MLSDNEAAASPSKDKLLARTCSAPNRPCLLPKIVFPVQMMIEHNGITAARLPSEHLFKF